MGEQRKTKVAGPTGQMVEGFEVAVKDSKDRWNDVEFEDGTRMRIKLSVVSAVRVPDQYDLQGNPMYVLNMAPTRRDAGRA
jgi:hypothetical protein